MKNDLPKTTWRLILSDPLPGKMNMALDAAILEASQSGRVQTTFRLYDWSPPCISLGYSQHYSDLDLHRLGEFGWDVVRRPTGGRAILHTDELTYSVIGQKNDPHLKGGLMSSYQRISKALYKALLDLGLLAEIHAGKNPLAHHQPVCFENPSDYEITVNGKKIIGSAQARKKEAILQHGSLPLTGDLTRITEVLAYPTEEDREAARRTVLEKAVTVSSALGVEISWDDAAQSFRRAFSEALNLDLVENSLTPWEMDRARELVETQFGSADWTHGIQIE
jgi:lipoate-protein ligase A